MQWSRNPFTAHLGHFEIQLIGAGIPDSGELPVVVAALFHFDACHFEELSQLGISR
jgi:hypothetical protein